jgi:hypothetical protein
MLKEDCRYLGDRAAHIPNGHVPIRLEKAHARNALPI